MPRVTRSKLTSPKSDAATKPTRGKRGKKEPVEEEEQIGEPVDTGRKSRGSTRGKAKAEISYKEAEEEEEEEMEEEVEEKEKSKKAAKGRGKGKQAVKRSLKNETEQNAADDPEDYSPVQKKGRGRQSKAATQASPSPRVGRRGRQVKETDAENEEEEMSEEKQEELAVEEDEVEAPNKNTSRQRGKAKSVEKTPQKEEVEQQTPPKRGRGRQSKGSTEPSPSPRGGRRGKETSEESSEAASEEAKVGRQRRSASKTESLAVTSGTRRSGRGSNRASQADWSVAGTKQTPPAAKKDEPEIPKEEEQEESESAESRKRKLSEEKESEAVERDAKKPRSSEDDSKDEYVTAEEESDSVQKEEEKKEGETSADEEKKETEEEEEKDYVVVNKEDVPAPDSKEVTDSLPPPAEPKQEVEKSSEMLAPEVPTVVPLTEAELTKQYNKVIRDQEDNSSMQVEVGSEAASDITGVSTRALDISDAVSMDATFNDPTEPSNESVTPDADKSNFSGLSVPVVTVTPSSPREITEEQNSEAQQESNSNEVEEKNNSSLDFTDEKNSTESFKVSNDHDSHMSEDSLSTSGATKVQNGTTEADSVPEPSPLITSTPAKAPAVIKENYVPSSPSITTRKFIPNPAFPAELSDPASCFTIVSYNILADCHMRRYDYSYTEPEYLEQTYRHNLMLSELDVLDADIVCLQEVDPDYYTQLLQPAMTSRGYGGFFMSRTKSYWNEGGATFYRTSKFNEISNSGVSLKDLAFKEVDASSLNEEVSHAVKKYLDRAEVVLVTKLECKKSGKHLSVANIHVLYDPKANDVQCVQVACAIKELVTTAGNDLNPHIICGDFNSEPGSAGYQLAKDGYLSDEHIRSLQAITGLDNNDGSSRSVIHHMWRAFQHTSSNLKSAYETAVGKEPEVSSLNKLTCASLDYIFYSSQTLDNVGVLEMLDPHVVYATGGIPSRDIPSDHLSVKSTFRFK